MKHEQIIDLLNERLTFLEKENPQENSENWFRLNEVKNILKMLKKDTKRNICPICGKECSIGMTLVNVGDKVYHMECYHK